jgi:4'-phosphopantetheinyl transferase
VARNKQPPDVQRALLGEIMMRAIIRKFKGIPLDQIEIGTSGKGKPVLKGNNDFHFNLSHSGKWVVMATSAHEVGVDVEQVKNAKYDVARRFFSPAEYQELESLEGEKKNDYFYSLWTVKESYLKFLGKGLTRALSSFSVINCNGIMELVPSGRHNSTVFFHQYQLPGNHMVAVCSPENIFSTEIRIIKKRELFSALKDER